MEKKIFFNIVNSRRWCLKSELLKQGPRLNFSENGLLIQSTLWRRGGRKAQ